MREVDGERRGCLFGPFLPLAGTAFCGVAFLPVEQGEEGGREMAGFLFFVMSTCMKMVGEFSGCPEEFHFVLFRKTRRTLDIA